MWDGAFISVILLRVFYMSLLKLSYDWGLLNVKLLLTCNLINWIMSLLLLWKIFVRGVWVNIRIYKKKKKSMLVVMEYIFFKIRLLFILLMLAMTTYMITPSTRVIQRYNQFKINWSLSFIITFLPDTLTLYCTNST